FCGCRQWVSFGTELFADFRRKHAIVEAGSVFWVESEIRIVHSYLIPWPDVAACRTHILVRADHSTNVVINETGDKHICSAECQCIGYYYDGTEVPLPNPVGILV